MAATALPGGVLLAQDESVLMQKSFRYSLPLFWIHTHAVLTDRRLAGVRPRLFLWVVPSGSESFSYPLSNIAQVRVNTSFNWLMMILGVLLVYWFVVKPFDTLSWVILVAAVLVIADCLQGKVTVMTNAGSGDGFWVDLFQKGRAQELAHRLSQAIAERG